MRRAHILTKPSRKAAFPEYIISFDTETHPDISDPEVQVLTLGTAVYRDNNNYEKFTFTSLSMFWDWVDSKTVRDKTLYMMAHNSDFDMKVLAFEHELEQRNWEFQGWTFPLPYRVDVRKGRKNLVVLDLANFYGPQKLSSIGSKLGRDKGEPEGGPADPRYFPCNGCIPGSEWWNVLHEYCMNDTMIVDEAFQEWVAFNTEHDLGGFKWTLAGQSLEAFRWRFMPQDKVFIHDNPDVTLLERESYHGGLTDCFKVGEEQGYFAKVDFNSMYPSVMINTPVPVKLIAYRSSRALPVSDLRKAIDEGYALTAKVTISTDKHRGLPFIAAMHEGKLILPEGTFITSLTTPEIKRALDNNMISKVHSYALYQQEVIFGEYVSFFYDLKVKYKSENNTSWTAIAKLFLNSLYGKFGQRTMKWKASEITPEQYVEEHRAPDGNHYTVRRLGDRSEMTDGYQEGSNSFCAIAAHITAYARMKLIDARNVAGKYHARYGDTDSLIVDAEGLANLRLAGLLNNTELGLLDIEAETEKGIDLVAPKTYRFGDKWTRKGIRKEAEEVRPGVFRQVKFEKLSGAMRRGNVNQARVSEVFKTLSGDYTKGEVGYRGWVSPFRLTVTGLL